ncbi:YfjI family protein [Roseomonas sp. GC11]|uniref:DUF3987 domain-containing protein n=1 Tax=Roseomonas sp. GC11 TaxID=2950546 RepID=UPI00210D08EA|nr:DUF3987 domain-containing protein [Roseomonas sp. GC11]MCQ4161272.1 YfjI family protein [Roseomonas sp. GC11]
MADGFTLHTLPEEAETAAWPMLRTEIATTDTLAPPPLPLQLFSPAWARWITRAADEAGAPPDYVAVPLLAVVGATLGNARWGRPWGKWRQPPVLNVICVGNPSANKSPALNMVTEPLSELTLALNGDWDERMRQFHTAGQEAKEYLSLWQNEVKEAVKRKLAPPLQPAAAREPDKPGKRRVLSTDPTIESARDLSRANPRGLLLWRDELAGWLAGMGRYGGNGTASSAGTERAFWLQTYDGNRWTADRVKDGDNSTDIPHLTWGILGGIQPDRLHSAMLSGEDDGLAARFLYIWPAPLSGRPRRPGGEGLPFPLMPALRRLRELPMPEGEPVLLPFSEEAAEAFNEWRGEVRDQEAAASGLLLSWLGKVPGMAVRLAVILAHLDWLVAPDGTPPPDHIDVRTAARAQAFLLDYALPMVRRCFGEAALPEVERDSRQLARWLLRQSPRPAVLNARALRRDPKGPGLATAPRIEAALRDLAELGWVRPALARGPGRPRSDWEVHPQLLGLHG